MFKKNDYKLKNDFRKLLLSTDEFYQSRIHAEEQRAIAKMWSKIIGENGCVAIARFQKQGHRLGIIIKTKKSTLGYLHEITNIADNSCISHLSSVHIGDIILEVNGVNLFLLNYAQLVLTLAGLPNNIQFVLWKKEGEGVYERTDNFDISSSEDHYHLIKNNDDIWMPTIKIIVQCTRTKTHGLNFIDSIHTRRNASKCVIQKINRDGYFFEDKRVSINDSILELSAADVRAYSDKEMNRLLSANKKDVMLIGISKYHSFGSSSDATSTAGSKCSLSISHKESYKIKPFIHSTPNLQSAHTLSKSMRIIRGKQSIAKERQKSEPIMVITDESCPLTICLDSSDDLKIYLVDVKEGDTRKSIICGFQPESSLQRKFRFKDEIVKVNNEDVSPMSSKDIGLLLKNCYQNKIPIKISVLRKFKGEAMKGINNLIVSPDIRTSEFDTRSCIYEDFCRNISTDDFDGSLVTVTLHKTDNSFGFRIKDIDGPTITEIISGSATHKNGLVKVDDKIIRINDIYVMDKDHSFVLTMIRSCRDRLNLELLRKTSTDYEVQFLENQTYFTNQNLNSSKSQELSPGIDHAVFLPLPPVPENIVNGK